MSLWRHEHTVKDTGQTFNGEKADMQTLRASNVIQHAWKAPGASGESMQQLTNDKIKDR